MKNNPYYDESKFSREDLLTSFLALCSTSLCFSENLDYSVLQWNSQQNIENKDEDAPHYSKALLESYCSLNLELRLATLDLLCAPHNRNTVLYKSWELNLLKLILPYSIKLENVAEKGFWLYL